VPLPWEKHARDEDKSQKPEDPYHDERTTTAAGLSDCTSTSGSGLRDSVTVSLPSSPIQASALD
jgi:hypothetical protein